jgi:hypothetical protein
MARIDTDGEPERAGSPYHGPDTLLAQHPEGTVNNELRNWTR